MSHLSFQHSERRQNLITAYIMLLPALVILIGVGVYPFVDSVLLTFYERLIGGLPKFVGLRNYIELIHDRVFQKTFINTFVFAVGAIAIKLPLGLLMGLVLNRAITCKNLTRGLVFLPWAVPPVIACYVWKWMMDDVSGIINFVLNRLHIIETQPVWLGDPGLAMFSVILVNVWQGAPFFGITILAGLQAISPDLYEAADIDGASAWRKFVHITLPSLKNVILISSLLSFIWTFNNFQFIHILTGGGPVNSTHIFSTLAYETSIKAHRLGLGATTVLMITPFLAVIIYVLTRKMMEEQD